MVMERPPTFAEFLAELEEERRRRQGPPPAEAVARVFRERGVQGLIEEGLIEPPRPPQEGGGVSFGEAYENLMLATPTAAVTAAQGLVPGEQQLERLTREVGPFEAWRQMQWPTLRTPWLPKVSGAVAGALAGPLAEPIVRRVVQAVTPSQFGPKGAAEAFLQPDVLIGGVKPLTGVARGVAGVGLRGARAVEREVVPAARRVAAAEAGAARIPKGPWAYHRTNKASLQGILSEGMTTGDFTTGKAIDFPGDVTIRVSVADIPKGQIGDYGGAKWYLPGYEAGGAIPAEKIEVQVGRRWVALADYPDLAAAAKPVAEPAPGLPIPGVRRAMEPVTPQAAEPIAGQELPLKMIRAGAEVEAAPLTGGTVPPVKPAALSPRPLREPRRDAGLRAEPLPPRQPPPPTQPPAPPTGELPSGRRPGGPQNIRPAQPVDNYQRVVDALTPERDPLIKRVWNSLPRLWYDRNYPFKAVSEQTGIPVRDLAQTVPGSGAAAENIVRKFYRPIKDAVGADEKRLLEYLVLRRNDDILARNPAASLPGGVEGIAGNIQAMKILKQKLGPERFAKVGAAATEVWRLNDEMVLQPMVAWGKSDPEMVRLLGMGIRPEPIISKRLYQELRTSYPHYVSFKRADFTDFLDEIETSFGRPEVNVGSTGLQRMDLAGSERRLSLTFETLVSDVYRTQALLARNRAAKSLGDALIEAQGLTGDEVIRFIEPSKTLATAERVSGAPPLPMGRAGVPPAKLDGKLSFYHDGEKYVAEVPREMEAAAKGLYAEPDNLILSMLRALAQPLRRGATEFDPFFLPVNVIRDSGSALFREKMIPFGPDHLAGLWGAIRKNALFEQAANDGALISGFVETGRGMGMRTRSALGALNIRNAADALLAIPRAISEANVIFERGTRVGVYRKLLREAPDANRVVPKTVFSQVTASDLDRISKVVRTRDATVDFSKAGTAMRVVNQVVPFLNPATQGGANIIRTMRDHPARFLALAAGFSGVAALVRLNNMRFETSELIPDYEYIRYWIVQFGEGTRKDGTKFPLYLRIPKGEFIAATTFPVEAMFHTARANEDRSAVEMLLDGGISALEVVSPLDVQQGVFAVLPPVASTAGGLQLGVDPFSQRPIVPRREEQRLPEQQFGPETSAVAIELGQKFGISPRKIDFAIKDYTAGAGRAVLWLTDMALEILGYTKPEAFGTGIEPPLEGAEALSRTPIGRVFGTRATQLEQRGWEQFSDVSLQTNREFNRLPLVNHLGIRLGEVGGSFDLTPGVPRDSIELTPAQRAEYQKLMASVVIPGLKTYIETYITPSKYAALSVETKRLYIQTAITTLKTRSRDSFRTILQGEPSKPSKPSTQSKPTATGTFAEQADAAAERLRKAGLMPTPTPVGAR